MEQKNVMTVIKQMVMVVLLYVKLSQVILVMQVFASVVTIFIIQEVHVLYVMHLVLDVLEQLVLTVQIVLIITNKFSQKESFIQVFINA